MPIYEYRCDKCEHEFEREQSMSDPPVKTCPACRGRKVTKLISRSSFVLKGGGWYKDGYSDSKSKKSGGESSDSSAADGSSTSSDSDAKGDAKSGAKDDGAKPGKKKASKSSGKSAA